MASFAELDNSNVVVNVLYVNNTDCLDENGIRTEAAGLAYLANVFPDKRFIQTSHTGAIRRDYAVVGGTYDHELDVFVGTQPFPSWTLNAEKYWDPPVARPPDEEGYTWFWDEDNLGWVKVEDI